NFSMAKTSDGRIGSWAPYAGYALNYQLSQSLRLNSSMSNAWIFANGRNSAQRTMIFSFGLIKNFSATPGMLSLGHHGRIVEGRVFRDNNINGVFNPGEPGFAGMRVELENGEVAMTDEAGRYKFSGVSAGEHEVSL